MVKVTPDSSSPAFLSLKLKMDSYYPLSATTWDSLTKHCRLKTVEAGSAIYDAGQLPGSFAYLHQGLCRVYITDENGNEYNKNFFTEGQFPGSMAALLTDTTSRFSIEALEPCELLEIHFKGFRKLLHQLEDLKLFQIIYLERNWLLAKEPREVALVQEDAGQRYSRFVEEHPQLAERLPLYHIASHLGITPTQLSRIRKNL